MCIQPVYNLHSRHRNQHIQSIAIVVGGLPVVLNRGEGSLFSCPLCTVRFWHPVRFRVSGSTTDDHSDPPHTVPPPQLSRVRGRRASLLDHFGVPSSPTHDTTRLSFIRATFHRLKRGQALDEGFNISTRRQPQPAAGITQHKPTAGMPSPYPRSLMVSFSTGPRSPSPYTNTHSPVAMTTSKDRSVQILQAGASQR